jgi:hypothetical protein
VANPFHEASALLLTKAAIQNFTSEERMCKYIGKYKLISME